MEERMSLIVHKVCEAAANRDLTVIESPSYASQGNATVTIGGLHYAVRVAMWERGYPFVTKTPMEIKQFATGSGKAQKHEMLACAQQYWETKDHNTADAVFLALLGEAKYDDLVEEEA